MTDKEINMEGFKLIDLVSSEPIIKSNESPDKFKNIAGVPKILTIDKIGDYAESIADPYGFIVARFIHFRNNKVGLKPDNYKILRNLAIKLIERDYINRYADLEFIEKACFNWVIDIYKTQQAKTDLIPFIKDSIDSETSLFTFYFKIEALGIQNQFSIGSVNITSFDKEFIEKEYKLLKTNHKITRSSFNKTYKDFFNKVIATIQVKAVIDKAYELAKKEVYLSLNALKCNLLQESIQKYYQIFDVDFNYHSSAFSAFLTRNNKSDPVLKFSMYRKFGAAPIIITEENLDHYRKFGLNKLSEFIINKKNTELYLLTEDAINHFGEMISTRDLHERVVMLISFFESLIVPKSNNRAKGQTYLKKSILSKLPYKDTDFLNPIITRFYDTRDKYLHNRIKLPIDLMELYEIQRMGLVLLLYLIDLNKTIDTLDEFLFYFKIS